MLTKNIFKIFLIMIFVVGILNFTYADSGPNIGANQAKTSAQSYLNSHNLPYTAVTPSIDAWQVKVKDTKTGEIKWIQFSIAKADSPDFGGPGRYDWIEGINDAWIVQVNDKNGKNVGRIYVDAETGKILKPILNEPTNSTKNENTTTNTTNTTNQVPPASTNSTGIILATALIIIIAGTGYWFYSKR
jgi:hypothetical protein